MASPDELVRQAWADQRVLRIQYQKHEDSEISVREVDVYRWDGIYIDTYCRLRGEPRTFRVDRILSANLLEEVFRLDPAVECFLRLHGWAESVPKPVLPGPGKEDTSYGFLRSRAVSPERGAGA